MNESFQKFILVSDEAAQNEAKKRMTKKQKKV